MRGAPLFLLAALALASAPARSEEPPPAECAGGTAPVVDDGGGPSPFERADVREVCARIACYCGCPHMQVSKCFCGVADEIRSQVAAGLDGGLSADEVVAAYVEEHGTWSLIVPPRRGFNWIIWLLPPVLLLGGALLVLGLGRRWSGPGPRPVPPRPAPDDLEGYRAEVARRLAEMD